MRWREEIAFESHVQVLLSLALSDVSVPVSVDSFGEPRNNANSETG